MRKLLCTITLLIAAGCFVSAQTRAPLDRRLGNLVDGEGIVLTDAEVLDLIGDQVFNETYLGAKKQYTDGHRLIWIGATEMLVGLGATVVGLSSIMQDLGGIVHLKYSEQEVRHDGINAKWAVILVEGGSLLASLGIVFFNTGIPLSIIGKNRLEWIADNYNSNRNLTWSVGATPNGVGVVLKF